MKKNSAIGAYRNTLLATGDAKAVEAAVFAHVNSELTAAMHRRESDWPGYVAALAKNLRLWTALSADVMSSENKLSDEMRGQILALSKFVRTRSMEILRLEKNVDAASLLEINANIAAGLRNTSR